MTDSTDMAAVSRANRSFYEAFEANDFDAMSDLWEHSDRAACTHPGWTILRGWGAIAASFYALFANGDPLQFILTNERVEEADTTAWVTVDENILGGRIGGTVAALNLFVRTAQGWKMVVHHASPVAAQPDGGS
jgi:ketosteroid isomerase-like protein